MTKKEFLNQLKSGLRRLQQQDIQEILRDQEEYINDAINNGREEVDVVASLGDPKKLASTLLADARITQAESATSFKGQLSSTFGALIAFLALAPLNLIVFLGPFLIILALILSGWATAGGVLIGMLGFIGVFFVKFIFVSVGFWAHLSLFSFTVGTIAAAALMIIFMFQVSRIFLWGTVSYIRWNYNFIEKQLHTN